MIYDITYSKQVNDLAPPNKRRPKVLALLNALIYPIQWLRDLFFTVYKLGSLSSKYNSAATYLKGARVNYVDKAVYEALQNVPTSTSPITYPDYWLKVSDNFIGVDQRIKFNSTIWILQGDQSPAHVTYDTANQNGALNKWFGVTTAPWIYLTNNSVDVNGFYIGQSSETSSGLAQSVAFEIDFLGQTYVVGSQYDFTVNIPTSIYSEINADPIIAEAIVRGFLDPIISAGIKYNISTY